jgi:hypothetical protein
MKLVTLEAAKAHLQMDHDQDDEDIDSIIDQASAAVLDYLNGGQDLYADSSGLIPNDANGDPDVPYQVRAATLLLIGILYKGNDQDKEWDHGYLPRPVLSLLYPLRTPSLG